MNNIVDIIGVRGYGCYVWLAYSAVAGVFIFNILSPLWRRKKLAQQLPINGGNSHES